MALNIITLTLTGIGSQHTSIGIHSKNRSTGNVVHRPRSAIDRGFESRSDQTKDYEIGMCCFFSKHAVLRRKSKDWLARSQDMCPSVDDMSIRGLLLQ